MNRKYILVDMFSGSYNEDNIGHEILNDQKNSITGKYYGYLPPRDNPNIRELGASRNDQFIKDILVVFVKKVSDDSTDRIVTGFYPSAIVYKEKQDGEKLERRIKDYDGSIKSVSYTLESDEYYPVSSEFGLVIETRKYSSHMFRAQRVYPGSYPEIDSKIIDYIGRLIDGKELEDDIIAQQELQEISGASNEILQAAPHRKIKLEVQSSGKRVLRNPQLTKSAIINADYQCEVDANHTTFLNQHDKHYMEGHHLIPCTEKNAKSIWHKFNRNIDCIENIVSLCPNCHRAIHLGNNDEKRKILKKLLDSRLSILKNVGIDITEEFLFQVYGVS